MIENVGDLGWGTLRTRAMMQSQAKVPPTGSGGMPRSSPGDLGVPFFSGGSATRATFPGTSGPTPARSRMVAGCAPCASASRATGPGTSGRSTRREHWPLKCTPCSGLCPTSSRLSIDWSPQMLTTDREGRATFGFGLWNVNLYNLLIIKAIRGSLCSLPASKHIPIISARKRGACRRAVSRF